MHLVFVRFLAAKYLSTDDVDRQHLSAIEALDEIADLLFRRAGRFLTVLEQQTLMEQVSKCGVAFQWCREYARRAGTLAYPVTPKVHKLQHVPLQASLINPAHVINYAEEGTVGSVCRVCNNSKFGRYKPNFQRVVLTKRLLGLLLRLEGYDS